MPPSKRESRHDLFERADWWLEWADRGLYVLIAILFLGAALVMGAYSVVTFLRDLRGNLPLGIIVFINDLLLVLIILEVLGTVRGYLATGTTSLRPFLYIGIISATRRILAIGAQTTLGEVGDESQFRRLMIDLGINGAVVLALALALYLFGRHQASADVVPDAPTEREGGSRWN